ncbi:DUF4320 family protein [Zhaonella formicivorans]|uniref:DUF4320 family protein n=1 Tax=Zhaonella formicivorans TaxID=2528593 RepID=UPI001D116D52|nr:DUF4320 family protein [Zhaonella formicivorans]
MAGRSGIDGHTENADKDKGDAKKVNTFASELCREAEIADRVGSETSMRAQVLREKTGLDPAISWSKTGKIQLNEEFTVTVSHFFVLSVIFFIRDYLLVVVNAALP